MTDKQANKQADKLKKEKHFSKDLPHYLQDKDGTLLISLYVKPNSKKNELKIDLEQLIIYTKVPPSKGKANKSILKILADFLEVSTSSLEIISGLKNQDKIVRINHYDKEFRQKIISKLSIF